MTPMDNMDSGLFADLPNAGAASKDKLWFATDTSQLFVSDGDTWIEVGGGATEYSVEVSIADNGPADRVLTIQVVDQANIPVLEQFALDVSFSGTADGLSTFTDGINYNWTGVLVGAQVDSSVNFNIAHAVTDANGVYEVGVNNPSGPGTKYLVVATPSGKTVIEPVVFAA